MIKHYFSLLLLIFLVGCSERDLEINRPYPDTTSLELLRAQLEAEKQATINPGTFEHLIGSLN